MLYYMLRNYNQVKKCIENYHNLACISKHTSPLSNFVHQMLAVQLLPVNMNFYKEGQYLTFCFNV